MLKDNLKPEAWALRQQWQKGPCCHTHTHTKKNMKIEFKSQPPWSAVSALLDISVAQPVDDLQGVSKVRGHFSIQINDSFRKPIGSFH